MIRPARTYTNMNMVSSHTDYTLINTCMQNVERLRNLLGNPIQCDDDWESISSKENHWDKKCTMEDKIDEIIIILNEMKKQRESYENQISKLVGIEIRMLKAELEGRLFLLEAENMQLKIANRKILAQDKMEARLLEEYRKESKSCNGYLKGFEAQLDNCLENVNDFFQAKFDIRDAVVQATIMRLWDKPPIMIKFKSLEIKRMIFRQKVEKLRGLNIFLENDMTEKERVIFYQARQLKKETIAKGGRCKVFDNKVVVNGEWRVWNENCQNFLPVEFPRYDIQKHIEW